MITDITLAQMAIAYGLLVMVFVLTAINRLEVNKDLLVASLRMTGQLFLAGLALKYLFKLDLWYLTLAVLFLMTAFAVHIVLGRVKQKIRYLGWIVFVSVFGGSGLTIFLIVVLVVGNEPWYQARYMIPISGMIIGNSMTATALVAERMTSEIREKVRLIETLLSLGATAREASMNSFRSAYRAALIPTISSMMGIGLVHLPGMMTGQVLSGTDPMIAVKYQIVIMIAILGCAALSCLICLLLVRKAVFDSCDRLIQADS